MAEIRVYDPHSKQDIAAPERGKTPVQTQPPRQGMVPDYATKAAEQPNDAPLGHAFIFMDIESFTPALAANIKKAKKKAGLFVQVYAKEAMPERYFALISKAPEEIDGFEFQVDNRGSRAARFSIKSYPTIYYVDGTGTRRYYDAVKDFDKFLRHVERVANNKRQK